MTRRRSPRRAAGSPGRWGLGLIVALGLAAVAGWQWRSAETQRDRAEKTLALATKTANGLVFDLAQKFRNVSGVPAKLISDMLDRARALQDQLRAAGELSPDLLRSQAAALYETSRTLLTLGDTKNALASAEKARDINDRLVKSDTGKTGWQHDLSFTLDEVGDVEVAQGNLAGALKSYRDSLAIRDRLAKSYPGNADWQRDLSVSYDKVGDVQVAQGDLAGALKSYRDSLAIARPPRQVRSRQSRLAARPLRFV